MSDPVILTCALTGVLTDPARCPVPVTPAQMAASAKEAFDAGAAVMHVHFRDQGEGRGRFPTWDPDVAAAIVDAIRAACPGVLINITTGVMGLDIEGPLACLYRLRPEMAALNCGSLNYLKVGRTDTWAWPPLLFQNPVDKIARMAEAMAAVGTIPECECFDTGIVRSVGLLVRTGVVIGPPHVSFVMGVQSGMPLKASWLPLLVEELPEGARWQVIAIGRAEVWPVLRRAAELGGHLRSGLEDTFYLPSGEKAASNGELIEALATLARDAGRSIASPDETRALLGLTGAEATS